MPKLTELYCENNKIKKIKNINSIKIMHCYNNRLINIPYFPNLHELLCDNNIQKIGKEYNIYDVNKYL